MFIISAKLTRKQLAMMFIGAGAAIVLAIMLVSVYRAGSAIPGYSGVRTAEDRRVFVQSFGWEVDPSSEQADTVLIPERFDAVYTAYNDIQIAQGLDLRFLVGREVRRYSYAVKNHPSGEEGVRITLLVYKDKVVGGDVASPALDGFMHGFEYPSA